MEKTMSGILIEAALKTTLHRLKDDPERGIRSLVDMGLRFSRTPFQQQFFKLSQTVLEDEKCPYYDLVQDIFSYADTDRLQRFGMNLGYHSCICGSKQIRDKERHLGCGIPWAVLLQIDPEKGEQLTQLDDAVSEGEKLGIYTWLLFPSADPERALDLLRAHPGSAFFLCCAPEQIQPALIDSLADLPNGMPALRIQEDPGETYARLREAGIPYSVWHVYGEEDLPAIRSGDLFTCAEQEKPVFTILIPRADSRDVTRLQTRQTVDRARREALYRTIPMELEWDGTSIQQVIAGGTFLTCFDPAGHLLDRDGGVLYPGASLFTVGLTGMLRLASSGKVSEESA